MHKFITFIKKDDKSVIETTTFVSVNVRQIFGFVVHKVKDRVAVKFLVEKEQSFTFITKKCLPTEDIMRALNQKILGFIKSEKEFILDLDSTFAGLVVGKRSRF